MIGIAGAMLGFPLAFAVTFWNSTSSAEFFGAFAAAFIAAAALILGAFNQDYIERKREDDFRQQKQTADALDLCFWLDHAAQELDNILKLVREMRDTLVVDEKANLEMPLEQFREVVTAQFLKELPQRAKAASQLPPKLASIVSRDLYRAYALADRILFLRGASSAFKPSINALNSYVMLIDHQKGKFRRSTLLVEEYLIGVGATKPGQLFHEN